MLRTTSLLFLVAGLAGCAGKLNYTGPAVQPPLVQEKSIAQPFDQVWARTLQTLQDRGYTTGSANKNTGLIRLRVAGNPEPYLDCGHVESMAATPGAKIKRVYQFPAAASHTAYEQLMRGNIFDVLRDMHMDSRVNVQMQAGSHNHTHVAVSTRYHLTRTVRMSNATKKPYEPIIDSISFTTGSKGTFPGGSQATTCVATGLLEREILNLSR